MPPDAPSSPMLPPGWAALALAALLAGCASPSPEAASPAEAPASPSPDELSRGTVGDAAPAAPPANTTAPAPARTFPRQEQDVSATLYARAANQSTGNMRDLSWEVQVPVGATLVRAEANTTSGPALTVGGDSLMIHLGTLDEGGPMLVAGNATDAGFATELAALPPGTMSIVVMFHAEGEPLAANVNRSAHLVVEFG
jgi:hypothetical protein